MSLADEQINVILKTLKEIQDDISNSKNDVDVAHCDAWIKTYNETLDKCVRYVGENGSILLFNALSKDFKPFPPVEVGRLPTRREGMETAIELRYKIVELMNYLNAESREKALRNGNILRLKDLIENGELLHACETSFNAGTKRAYWDACLHALRHLETMIRKKGGFPSSVVGTDLVTKAFNPKDGKLKIPLCDDVAEEQGFMLINMGMVKFHRNAKGHREGEISRRNALKIIGYVDYLLNLLKTAVPRTVPDQPKGSVPISKR